MCLWHVFPGREGLYRYSKFKTLAIYPKGPFQVTCLYWWDSPETVGWVILFLKFNLVNFSFNGFRMRTCNARPRIVYILSREDRLFLREENPNISFSGGGEASAGGLSIPCYLQTFSRGLSFFPKIKIKIS